MEPTRYGKLSRNTGPILGAVLALACLVEAGEEKTVRVPILEDGKTGFTEWAYTFGDPGNGWMLSDFEASAWDSGRAGFGGNGTDAVYLTEWTSSDIWMRKSFTANPGKFSSLILNLNLDDSHEVYLNGALVHESPEWTAGPRQVEIPNTLLEGVNLLAIHCLNTGGAQIADAGIDGVRTVPARTLVQDAANGGAEWRYSTDTPGSSWFTAAYDDQGWALGRSGFGTGDYYGSKVATAWDTPEIWIRRTITLEQMHSHYLISLFADDDIEVFLNGNSVFSRGVTADYAEKLFSAEKLPLLQGENVIAIHCVNSGGGPSMVDFSLFGVELDAVPVGVRSISRAPGQRRSQHGIFRVDGRMESPSPEGGVRKPGRVPRAGRVSFRIRQ